MITPEKACDFIVKTGKMVILKSCHGIGEVSIIVCGLSILWWITNNDSKKAKEGATGSVVVYIGTKLVEILVK